MILKKKENNLLEDKNLIKKTRQYFNNQLTKILKGNRQKASYQAKKY
jgi:hypothetical protein